MFSNTKNRNEQLEKVVSRTDSLAESVATRNSFFFDWNKPAKGQEEMDLKVFLDEHPEVYGLKNFAKASISYNQCINNDKKNPQQIPEYHCMDSRKEYRRTKEACYLLDANESKKFEM